MTFSVSNSCEDLLSTLDSPPPPRQSKRLREKKDAEVSSHAQRLLRSPLEEQPSELKQRRILKVPSPVIEITRDEVFGLGQQARQHFEMEMLSTLGEDVLEQIEFEIEKAAEERAVGVQLKRGHYQEIERIQQSKTEEIGSQFFELYQILTTKHCLNKPEGQIILQLAHEIIEEVPDSMAMKEIDSNEICEEAQILSEQLFDKLPISVPEGSKKALAANLHKAFQEGEPMDLIAEGARLDKIKIACTQLGFLLFLAQRDIQLTAACIGKNEKEEALNKIADEVETILNEAAERIHEHANAHHHVSIQSVPEAAFSRMAIEMARMMLLKTGSINFGIIDSVAKILIPEVFIDTVADKNLKLILVNLASTPLVWQIIAQAQPPNSREIPSDQAIRAHLSLPLHHEITQHDAQVFILSALLDHFRQAYAGTCFTTAPLIKILFHQLHQFTADLAEITQNGCLQRAVQTDIKQFPFRARVTNEYLDVLITADQEGNIIATKRYDLSPDKADQWPEPAEDAHLSQAPGIQAVCNAIGVTDIDEAIIFAVGQLPKTFSVNQLLRKLSEHAFQIQEAAPYRLRNQQRFTEEEFFERAQFAFGVQTNHPLHRAYEQIGASMVYYFGSNFMIPSLVGLRMQELLKDASKPLSAQVQGKYRKLLKECFLPLITRMQYQYNPNIEDCKTLFDDGNQGTKEHSNYGYELYDTGLPEDFSYSTELLAQIEQETMLVKYDKFSEFAPPTEWKPVNTEEKFREFLIEVITETCSQFQAQSRTVAESEEWSNAAQIMISHVSKKSFTTKLIHQLFGRGSELKREYKKNEFTMSTKPWLFRWGGDFDAVLQTYYGFTKSPSKLSPYNGTPKEVLAKCINYIKEQPEIIREGLDDPYNPIVITAPTHCFLLRPFEETFQAAWHSEVPTNEYIAQHVELPGLKLCNRKLSVNQRKKLINFVAENLWYTRKMEKDDWERQQLTEASKQILDAKIEHEPSLFSQTAENFKQALFHMAVTSRAEDPNVGKRNTPWENRFSTALNNLFKKLVPDHKRDRTIRKSVAKQLIDFARNRQDTMCLSEKASERFKELMLKAPARCKLKEFRDYLLDAAYQARTKDIYREEKKWKASMANIVDTKLFSLLAKKTREQFISTGIVTHDTNWKTELHDLHFIFMVNPGTQKIELCRYIPDTQEVIFVNQDDWFPKHGKHASWQFPDNYRVWPHEPLFNVNKMMFGQ